eukprot:3459370-Rhodomonas_salina.2
MILYQKPTTPNRIVAKLAIAYSHQAPTTQHCTRPSVQVNAEPAALFLYQKIRPRRLRDQIRLRLRPGVVGRSESTSSEPEAPPSESFNLKFGPGPGTARLPAARGFTLNFKLTL